MDEQEFLKERFKSAVSSTVKAISGNFDIEIKFGNHTASKENSINFLGEIPIDGAISKNGDKGVPYLIENNETDAGKKIMEIASYIDKKIK